jgi:hypothetical protein
VPVQQQPPAQAAEQVAAQPVQPAPAAQPNESRWRIGRLLGMFGN